MTVLGIAQPKDYHPYVWKQLEEGCMLDETLDQEPDVVVIEPGPFLDGSVPLCVDKDNDTYYGTFPHPDLTHLLITDNLPLLEEKLSELVPWGLV